MKLFKKKSIISLVLLTIALTFLIVVSSRYHGKKVHLSFDDVSICFKELTRDSTKYNSIFDHPFLRELLNLHNSTGAKFTLYIYEKDEDYNICKFPTKYANEFSANGDWLKIGFHAISPTVSKDSISIEPLFQRSFYIVDSVLSSLFKNAKARKLRLHFFYATQNEVSYLNKKGITTLYSADDNRTSYSLDDSLNEYLIKNESFEQGGGKLY